MTAWLLLPSPLLGPASWQPVADRLRDAGDDVAVATAGAATRPADVLAAYVAAARDLEAPVVVAHSNAGLFAPAVADAAAAPVTGYVDAALAASTGPTPLAPPAFLAFLAGLADDDGLLPPWSQWWGDVDLFPDDATRARVEAEQPRLPLAYFHATLETPAGWESRPPGLPGLRRHLRRRDGPGAGTRLAGPAARRPGPWRPPVPAPRPGRDGDRSARAGQ